MILTYYTATTMIIIAYLLGSIPSAVWIGKKYYGIDIREYGSKNAGTTNMLRVLGKRAALPVFGLDFLKGFVAVTIIDLMKYDSVFADGANENWFYILRFIAVFAAVAGHIFPIFAGFRGGKGVATRVGAIMGVNAPLVLLCFGVWFLVLMVTHYVSLASMVAGCSFPIFTLISPKVNHLVPFVVFSFIIAILLIYTHRKNIERLQAGTESIIYIRNPPRVKQAPRESNDLGGTKKRSRSCRSGQIIAISKHNRIKNAGILLENRFFSLSLYRTLGRNHVRGKPDKNIRDEFSREPGNAGTDRLFQGRNILVLRDGQGDRQAAPPVQKGRREER